LRSGRGIGLGPQAVRAGYAGVWRSSNGWGAKAHDDLRVGLLSPTAAREIVRLPQGKPGAEVLEAVRLESLSRAEPAGVVDLWLGCADRSQQQYLLAHPREAPLQAKDVNPAGAIRD
jgi:hypothetical protein